jgi:hypothetical protein
VANTLRLTSSPPLVPFEQLTAHGHATALRAPKVRNPEEPVSREKQTGEFGVYLSEKRREIDVVAIGSTNVEQML